MEDKFIEYFQDKNLDIRETHDARFMDQKVTPDVLAINADIVLTYVSEKEDDTIEFTANDIWNFDYANENVKDIFRKPDLNDTRAVAEYNKFFQQPLKALSYAGILNCDKRGNKNYFSIREKELLEIIAMKERNSLIFLQVYLEKVMTDSGLWNHFETFFERQDRHSFTALKTTYEEFIREHTPIRGVFEPRRIFTKVINPLAFGQAKKGTKRGNLSPQPIEYDELMYNRRNWRDAEKQRGETRQEFDARMEELRDQADAYTKYTVAKAKKLVREKYRPNSEVQEEGSVGVEANEVHHIFMESEFPSIASYTENLILLTSNQHRLQAHPHSNFSIVDKDFQLVCLLAKNESIETSLNAEEPIYTKEDYCFVLNTGLDEAFEEGEEFSEIRHRLVDIYNRI